MKGNSCGSSVPVSSVKMSPKLVDIINLPDLPLDIIISYLEDKDLQCFHQVSRSWKSELESRSKDNQRRKDLVQTIRENKENIRTRNGPDTPQEPTLPALAQRAIRERNSQDIALKKIGNSNMALMECTNQFETTPTSVTNAASSAVSTPVDLNSFLTPTSHFVFQDFQKAEESLTPGQKLFQCRKCRGPVPSPATPGITDSRGDSSRRHSQPNRVKLISRLEGEPFTHYPPHLESPQKRECKKAKTLSSVDLSPIAYMSPSPVTVASLGEKMSHSLVLSSPCLTSASSDINALPPLSSPGEYTVKRSTSCSSIMAIDLPRKLVGDVCSPIELNLNASGMDNDSFFTSLHHHHGLSSVDLSNSLNCSRSCCSPRRLHHSSQLHHHHSSHFSDSGLSFEGDSIDSSVFTPKEYYEYSNIIPSPVVPPSSQFSSMERGRDAVNFSDGQLSLSSYSHLNRSDHSLDFNGNSMLIANEPVISDVLQCPNPKCGFRFCSKCEESEHLGRSCHVVSSEQFESFASFGNESNSFGGEISNISSSGNTKSNKKSNASSSSGKSNKHKNQKKIPLRRLARL